MTLSLLVIFFAAAGEMFRSTVLLDRDCQTLSDHASRVDSALFRLRRDVWNSRQIVVGDTRRLELTTFTDQIVWKTNADGSVTRSAPNQRSTRWDGIAATWALSSDGIGLTISDGGSVPMRLTSQVLLAKRATP
jgi:hypothetical protein